MRLLMPVPVCLCLAAAAAFLPTPAYAESDVTCVAPGDRAFPVTTRIHGGPDSYEAGGGYGTWYLDLTNTTTRTCANIHPVVVLVDDERALEPAQPLMEFYDGTARDGATRPHLVRFERTDADELVGAFADDRAGFPGFTVGPGKTLTVKVRLAVTSDAVPNEVTANAAVVQRHDDDGDWIGQSNDYRFGIVTEPAAERSAAPERSPAPKDRPDPKDRPAPQDSSTLGRSAAPENSAAPVPTAPPTTDRLPFADEAEELALTGRPLAAAIAAVALLLLTGGTLLLARRRR